MDPTIQSLGAWITTWHLEILLGVCLAMLIGISIMLWNLYRHLPTEMLSEMRAQLTALEPRQQYLQEMLQNDMHRAREESIRSARQAREELRGNLNDSGNALMNRMSENARMQKDQLDSFARQLVEMTRLNEDKFDALRLSIENQLRQLREDNGQKLDQMRNTVDEKLQGVLERRLGRSFKQVSERLEQVYQGLGEMRTLASGVGDLKKVLTNVKTRGTWGEVQLSRILEQILTPDQYDTNVATRNNSSERVEFAIRLPGSRDDGARVVWLPIDSKFPQEDYQRLVDAQEAADKASAERWIKQLEVRIRAEAKLIKEKYIAPPQTTDFGIMFLPVEGLYAEVLRCPGLCDLLQREYRILVTGPTTLAALLNSLQMGFRTLAIEKRSSEVWELLGMVKSEFGKFGEVLAKTKKKLQEASHTIDKAEVRTRVITRKLQKVEEAPMNQSDALEDAHEGARN